MARKKSSQRRAPRRANEAKAAQRILPIDRDSDASGIIPPPSPAADHTDVSALWSDTRAGARAGRGFHYQDAVGAWLCGQVLAGALAIVRIIPEGWEDLSCEGNAPWHVQVKSRQERIGDFRPSEVATHLLDMGEKHSRREEAGLDGQSVLVLERPVNGESFDDWGTAVDDALPSDHPILLAVQVAGRRRGLTEDQILSIRRGVSLFVLPWRAAAERTRDAVANQFGLLPAASESVVLALRDEIARCADRNAAEGWATREGPDRTRIQRVAETSASLIDRASMEEALANGVCEPVNFDQPLSDASFYEGVEVQPGHLAAGLPSPRPDLTGQVVRALDSGATVLLTGPSGVGKSAVMWAGAYSTRHILWYRIRRLHEGDVAAVVRLAKAMNPSLRTPIGFVVDGVGVGAFQAWDALVRELAVVPGAVLLGSARTEDLLTLRTLASCTTITVALDEAVAERIHAALLTSGQTSAPHWRESYDVAAGLTLEYTYLLTRGRRLGDVIREQVNRRVVEHRDLELQVLALTSVAHQWGADLPLRSVQDQLGADDASFRVALSRLDAEHLVQVRGTRLTGLHQLRSTALARSVHAAPPPPLAESVSAVIDLLDDDQLQLFVSGALGAQRDLDDIVLDRVAAELGRRRNPVAWTAVLQALRVVDFQRQAVVWATILDRHGVVPADRPITLQLAMLDSDVLPIFKTEIIAAVEEIRSSADGSSPLRDALLSEIGSAEISAVLESSPDASTASRFLAVLAGTGLDRIAIASPTGNASPLGQLLIQAPAQIFGDLVSAAGAVHASLAHRFVDHAGGQDAVFAKLRAHSPWLVEVAVKDHVDPPIAYARLMHVSDRAEADIDKSTRDFGRILLRCVPQCGSVDVQAVLAGNVPLQFGDHTSAVSKLQRRNDHPPTEVAWNTLRSQVAAAAMGSIDPTTRVSVAHTLVGEVHQYLRDLTRAWSVSQGRPRDAIQLEAQRTHLREQADALTLPLDRSDLFATPADQAINGISNDHLHSLVQGVGDKLTSRIHSAEREWASIAAYTGDTLRSSVQDVLGGERWELMDRTAPAELADLDRILNDLHAILAELAWGALTPAQIVSTARSGPYDEALTRVAQRARSAAETRAADLLDAFQASAHAAGLSVQVFTQPLLDPEAVEWPPIQVAVGLHAASVPEALEAIAAASDLLMTPGTRPADTVPVLLVPMFRGRPIRHLARQVITSIWPAAELFDSWAVSLPSECLTPLTDAVIQAHQALQGLSGLAALGRLRDIQPVHQQLADDEAARYQAAHAEITTLEAPDIVVAEIIDYLASLATRVQTELEEGPPNGQEQDTLAAQIAALVAGVTTEAGTALESLTIVSLQWDLDPPTAAELLAQLG
ncbi:hypothetical protein [Kribbella sindirgiensis]|uniref:Uncharacterized protein n=1 Tax=Kribbella sindirgiensis TaxID=1124744 RepID=A0A4R0IQ30_9ACTN|nr:hypothetical protein [Kribbella sindirgiensis]TCC35109.1 hypothetical protein E0H50_14685 [Kribbella sindirgiensis]